MPSLDDILVRRADVMARETSDGAVLVDALSGKCWELNRVGATFWSFLDPPVSLKEVCDRLAARYGMPPDIIERDVFAITVELTKAGLLQTSRPDPNRNAK